MLYKLNILNYLMKKRFQEATDTQSDIGLKTRMLSMFAMNSTVSVQQLAQVGIIFYGVFFFKWWF